MSRKMWKLSLLAIASAAVACGQDEPVPAPESSSPEVGAIVEPAELEPGENDLAPFNVQDVIRRVHFSFRPEGSLFTGGHSTYAVTVDGAAVKVSPVKHLETRPEPDPRAPGLRRRIAPIVGAPLVIETASIARDGARLSPTEAPSVDDDGRLVRRGAAVSEVLRNREEGMEISWDFPARPQGRGDLEVRVSASGMELVAETKTGLHFRDPSSELGVRFGHATWIDADGDRTDVPARWNRGQIVMQVPADVIDRSAYPAVLDPVLGTETGVDSAIVGPASGGQSRPSVAHTGTTYFVAWTDYRASTNSQIVATRVNSVGTVLDTSGIFVTDMTSYADNPNVVFDGTNFFVVFDRGGDIYGRRFTTAGVAVDASPFAINNNAAFAYNAFAVYGGGYTYVVWQDYRNWATTGYDIYGTRVTGTTITDGVGSGVAITTATNDQSYPKVTYGGGNFFAVWQDRRSGTTNDVYGARINATTGAVVDTTGIAVSTAANDQNQPWPASDGTDYFVVWWDTRLAADYNIWGQRVTSAGTLNGGEILVNNNTSYQYYPSVTFNGTNYQAVWTDYRGPGLYGQRVVPATGALLDTASGLRIDAMAIAGFVYEPRVFANGANIYVAWYQYVGGEGSQDLYGSRMTTTPSLSDGAGDLLASSANGQTQVDVATDGTNYFVVWRDDRGGAVGIYGARVSGATGASLDPSGILLSPGGQYESHPSVAYNGTNYLVVWYDSRSPSWGIWGTRVNTSGTVLDATGLGLFLNSSGNQPYEPRVASDGTNWLVVWYDYRNSATTESDIYGGRVTAAGASSDPAGFIISNADNYQFGHAVAYGGGTYLAAWSDYRSGTSYDLYAQRVTSTGMLTGAAIAVNTGPGWIDTGGMGIAFATNFVIVYSDAFIRRARVTTAGVVLDDTQITTACCFYRPSIAFDSDVFLVTFAQSTTPGYNVLGTRLDGTTVADLDPTDWNVTTGGGVAYDQPIVSAQLDRGLVAYTRYDATTGITSDRIRTRTITRLAQGATCTLGLDCVTGNCVDGVCCNSTCGGGSATDCQACSTAAGASVNGTCQTLPTTHTCRASAGTCDVAETCNGTATTCPTDGFSAATTVCRSSAGVCDVAENCTGTSASCPADSYQPGTTECRAAVSTCDAAENCTGTSASCPTDGFASSTTVCRASAGACDIAENCTGTSTTCPSDTLRPSTFTCRSAADVCDVAENCSGTSATCPADAFRPTTFECRGSAGACDPAEFCSGTAAACPTNVLSPSTTVCRAAATTCDVAENCTGTSITCPTDVFAPSSTVCRAAAAGGCDVAENCTGASSVCPADAFAASSTVCRTSAGVCDLAENCTGTSSSCPADSFRPTSFECRAAADVCDLAENCTGTSAACPSNALAPVTTVCRAAAAGGCDVPENCTGTSVSCPTNAFEPSTTVCRPSAGACDVAENCSGTSATCPTDALRASTVTCRPSAGTCDVPENCTGTSASCPTDALVSSGVECRAAAGTCDVAEACTGSGPACPSDVVSPSTTVCRASTGVCDSEETCTGTSSACPADAFAPSTTVCRASAAPCDAEETCSGTSSSCPADSLETAGVVCRDAVDVCDAAEVCSGTSSACPADGVIASGTLCRPGVGACDVGETCNGTATSCPPDAFASAGTSCRTPAGPCDSEETCSGSSANCPADALQPAGTVCRPAANDCDLDEACTGSAVSCPANGFRPAGTACEDGDECTAFESCNATGTCMGGSDALTFDPASPLDLPDTFVGATSAPVTVTMTNNGSLDLDLMTITAEPEFPLTPASTLPFTLAGGASDGIDVAFTPVAIGTASGTVVVDTGGCTFQLDVSGVGLSADLSVQPSDGDFGDVNIQGAGTSRNYVITNIGTGTVTVDEVKLDVGTDFTLTPLSPPAYPVDLDPGDDAVVTIVALPQSVGAVADQMLIDYTPPGAPPDTIPFDLSANGVCPDCTPDAGPMDPDAGTPPPPPSGGCACRAASGDASAGSIVLVVFALGAVVAIRRRRSR